MERCRLKIDELLQSALMICDGDLSQYDIILKSPISYYEAKLKDYVARYNAGDRAAKQNEAKVKQAGRVRR